MPIYEFVCADCQSKFEKYVRAFREAVCCPHCASEVVERQLSRFALAGPARSDPGPGPGGSAGCCGGSCGCAH